jgi:uncharacterized paraquat-inducible protein A
MSNQVSHRVGCEDCGSEFRVIPEELDTPQDTPAWCCYCGAQLTDYDIEEEENE